MRALKIVTEGLVTSFRYPHFVQGVHPTYEMPPPATIYGHLCSAVGNYIPVDATRFAYHFTYDAKFFDYEHLHFFGSKPKLNPFNREMLFRPRLTLYLDNLELAPYLASPRYAVVLGRSQDLMTQGPVSEIELEPANEAFYAGTLLPLSDAAIIGGQSYAVTMPRFVDEYRQPYFDQYAVLQRPVRFPGDSGLVFDDWEIWVDPEPDASHPNFPGLQRGIRWLTWA